MKRRIVLVSVFLLSLSLPTMGQAPTPKIVRHTANFVGLDLALSSSSHFDTSFSIKMDPTIAGNALVVWTQWGGPTNVTITDNQGDVYTAGPAVNTNCPGDQCTYAFYLCNVPEGINSISISADPAQTYWGGMVDEIANTTASDCVDAVGSNSSLSNTFPTVSLDTTVSGDLIVQTANTPGFPISSWNPSGFTGEPLILNAQIGYAEQYQAQSSAGGLTTSMAYSGSAKWGSLALAFKPGSSGNTPTGIYIQSMDQWTFRSPPGNSLSLKFPFHGNLLALSWTSPQNITSVSDDVNGFWVRTGEAANGVSGVASSWRKDNASPGILGITVGDAGNVIDLGITLYDIAGAAASPLDAVGTCTGVQNNFGDLVLTGGTCGFAPAQPNELILAVTSIDNNSLTGVAAPSGASLDPQDNAQITNGLIQGLDGWGHFNDPNTSALSWTWTTDQSQQPGGVNNWAAVLAAFKPSDLSSNLDTTAPSTPSALGAAVMSSSQINLSWVASTDNVGVTGYFLERCQGTGCTSFALIAFLSELAYIDTGLAASSTYSYRVRATDAAGNLSGYSAIASGTTQTPEPIPDVTSPTVPSNLAATAVSASQITLSWAASTDNVGVTGYFIERCQGAGCSEFVGIATVSGTTYVDTALIASTTYSYRVRAADAAGNLSAYSGTVTAATAAGSGMPIPVAAYGFNEASGIIVNDSSGHGNTGTLLNAVWSTGGRFGSAVSFNGTNARVIVNDSTSLHLTNRFTLEAWINPSEVPMQWQDIIYKPNDNWFLSATSTYDGVPGGGVLLMAGNEPLVLGNEVLIPDIWTHLAMTYDGSTLRFYVNGTLVNSTLESGSAQTSKDALQIGGDNIYGQFFNGLIDEVRIYNVVLNQEQIQIDMDTPLP